MIIVSQFGPFHARHGAESAEAMNWLQVFVTTYANYSKLPPRKIRDLSLLLEILPKIIGKLGRMSRIEALEKYQDYLHEQGKVLFSRLASKSINERTTIFHAYSAFQELCWSRCEEMGVRKVLDWGIAHPEYLNRLLADEAVRWGFEMPVMSKTNRILDEFERVDRIVIPSAFVERSFLEYEFPEEKLFLNPYGVSSTLFNPRPHIRPHDSPLRIAFSGALSLRKGVLYLLEAVRLLKQRGVPCELNLFAEEWEKPIKETALKFRECVTYQGAVPHHQLPDWYADIDVFVLPSLAEGMARAVIEAMGCGLPCIVTPHCGYEGIIVDGENGFEVPIRDSLAIADRLQLLYEQAELRQQLSANALKTAQNQTWDKYKQGLQKLYQELGE